MTVEPRPVEDLVPRDVEEIATLVRRVQSLPTAAAELVAREFVAARLAAADRENAELRGEVERLRGQCDARAGFVNGAAEVQIRLTAERDDLRAQLAAAQAQLAEAHAWLAKAEPYPGRNGDHFAGLDAALRCPTCMPFRPGPAASGGQS